MILRRARDLAVGDVALISSGGAPGWWDVTEVRVWTELLSAEPKVWVKLGKPPEAVWICLCARDLVQVMPKFGTPDLRGRVNDPSTG